ncbi:MAG: glycosyltransferase [Betaproteobacteria bacterium]|nr:glycosyltransferase [Betaproteobacteria bacterium]MCL2886426.1 glycosyltransferase [Betaproteobacteria bacterium]
MNEAAVIRRESWLLGGIGLLLFMAGLWQQPFIGFESRFAVFAQEMLRHGPSWFPTTWGEPYPDYPVTGTLLIALGSLPFGAVTRFSAALPTALAAALNLVILYRLLAPHAKEWAWLALCLQVMTVTFLAEARSISLDQMVATLTLLAFYLAYSADRTGQAPRWLPLVLILGFCVRGPLGIVIPASAVISYYALSSQWRALLRFAIQAALLLALLWLALLALAWWQYGADFMKDVVRMQVAGRLEAQGRSEPFYYFTRSFGNYALSYPLAVLTLALLAPTLLRQPQTPARQLVLALAGAALLILAGLSMPETKKARYILAATPALSALAAYSWVAAGSRALRWLRAALASLFAALPLLLIAALVIIHRRSEYQDLSLILPCTVLAALQIALLIVRRKVEAPRRGAIYAGIAALAVWSAMVLVVEPVLLRKQDSSHFVAAVEAQRRAQPGTLALFGMTRDGAAIKYLVNADADLAPQFPRDAAALTALPRPAYVVINADAAKALPASALSTATRVASGQFNGEPFLAFHLP